MAGMIRADAEAHDRYAPARASDFRPARVRDGQVRAVVDAMPPYNPGMTNDCARPLDSIASGANR